MRILGMILGNIFCALAINGFLAPHKLLSGGVGGIAILLNATTGIQIGLTVFLMNLPLFLVSYRKLDREFTLYSFINMMLFSFTLLFTSNLFRQFTVDDILLSAVFGGIFNGLGMGLTFKSRSSQGGTDIIAAFIKKKWNIKITNVLMGANLIIVSIGGAAFGAERAMYTLIAMYVAYQVVDKVQLMFNNKLSVMIISQKSEELSSEIMDEIGRGVTFFKAEGAYSGSDQKVVYSIVNSSELQKLRTIVSRVDPNAFMSVNEATEVRGRGFKESLI
ncbi:YitT family protein [Peptoclostridium sp.]|uniref:YitT family protein n=1 Tax=Peptoclostridium sp. TaxID=1904860 RepID=UPI0025FFDD6C|nr:YitT family protein [Peptoclostridium sp.]